MGASAERAPVACSTWARRAASRSMSGGLTCSAGAALEGQVVEGQCHQGPETADLARDAAHGVLAEAAARGDHDHRCAVLILARADVVDAADAEEALDALLHRLHQVRVLLL